ncbi:MAG: hypothetical protein QXZ09_08280 [Candidatus Methanomethylicaceae archaeon]
MKITRRMCGTVREGIRLWLRVRISGIKNHLVGLLPNTTGQQIKQYGNRISQYENLLACLRPSKHARRQLTQSVVRITKELKKKLRRNLKQPKGTDMAQPGWLIRAYEEIRNLLD